MKKVVIITGLIVITAAFIGVLLLSGGTKQTDYGKLIGDWMRTDGDYVIRISDIHADGTIQASYFNPNPIHVAQATASLKNDAVVLFVKLQDAGYPGSTYDLVYILKEDVLQGTYFQARDKELYDVVFVRNNNELKPMD
jgi:hypothetical protein